MFCLFFFWGFHLCAQFVLGFSVLLFAVYLSVLVMAKGFRLRLGHSAGRLSKEGRGKRRATSSSSMSMEWIRDLCYDDYDESDLEHWGLHSRFFRAKAEAADQLRDLFDPNYGPWEEVYEDSDSMDLEHQGAMDESRAGFSWIDRGVVDLSLGASKRVDCEPQILSSLKVGPKESCGAAIATFAASGNPNSTVELGSTAESVKVEEVVKGMQSYGQVKRPRFPVNGHCKKKVIMGRNFLLVSRDCLRELKIGRRFQFFHKPSLSTVAVNVQ